MLETVRGMLAGMRSDCQNCFFAATHANGQKVPMHCVIRVEFQDGTRKEATQDYHGSGVPHIHVLFFFDDIVLEQINIPDNISASMAGHAAALAGYIKSSQTDKYGSTPWPIFEGVSHWDPTTKQLHLHHTADDNAAGIRAFFIDIMEVLKCHQDLQMADDNAGLLRAYVTKYISNFSDSAQDEWLNDAASATSMAASVLMRYKPTEPEMILQLMGASCRQWDISTKSRGKRNFIVPLPEQPDQPIEVKMYMAADWAAGVLPLIDYLRKTTCKGEICKWLSEVHTSTGSLCSLQEFAANYTMCGEKVVAAECLSRLNDKSFGQWLMLFVPFKNPLEFVNNDMLNLVPDTFRYFTMAMHCPHDIARAMCHSLAAIEQDMRLEAHTQHHINTFINGCAASSTLIEKYLSGALDAHAEEQQRAERIEQRIATGYQQSEITDWTFNLREFMEKLTEQVDRDFEINLCDNESRIDELREHALQHGRIIVCFGAPGTGKTSAVFNIIDYAMRWNGRVLFALPTAQLAARMRERWGNAIDIDTCAAAFGFMENISAGAMPSLIIYDLIVIDELSQLECWQAEHIFKLWIASDKIPAVCFLGDKGQLAGFGDARAWHSIMWRKFVWERTLTEVHRCQDPMFQLILDEIRTALPCEETMAVFQSRVIWGSEPSVEQVRKLLHAHANTTVLTCSRWGAFKVNACALAALFPRFPPRVVVDGDVESYPENYIDGVMKNVSQLMPAPVPVFNGMAVYLTCPHIIRSKHLLRGQAPSLIFVGFFLGHYSLAHPGDGNPGQDGMPFTLTDASRLLVAVGVSTFLRSGA